MIAQRASLLIATLWAGSLWTIGYIAAPTLFASLPDSVLAGAIAGRLFRIEAWLSVGCALALVVLMRVRPRGSARSQRSALWLVVAMLGCALIGYFALQPFMSALREAAGPAGVMVSAARTQFAVLHALASAIYLAQSLLGAVLVLSEAARGSGLRPTIRS